MPAPATLRIAIGPQQMRVAVLPVGAAGGHAWQLPIGGASPGVPLLRHPPTPLALEEAIAAVEDAVMPLVRQLPAGARLVTRDPFAHDLLAWRQSGPGDELSIEDIERAFDDMAAVVLGRPASASTLPADAVFDGWLLVLREFMHHGAFDRITVERSA